MCSANDGAVRRGARGLAEAAARRDTLASILARSVLLILQRVFSGTAQPFRCPPTHTLLITVTITHCMAVSVAGLHCTTTHTHKQRPLPQSLNTSTQHSLARRATLILRRTAAFSSVLSVAFRRFHLPRFLYPATLLARFKDPMH